MGTKSNWGDSHVRLKRLYEAHAKGMTQKEFGAKFGIGSQSMVAQYVNGIRPLNYEAAAKFARGLGCTIYDISPEMAASIKEEILPVLGRALRRAAVLACFALLPLSVPSPSHASVLRDAPANCVLCKLFGRWWRTLLALIGATAPVAGCSTIDEHTAPPADWPQLELVEHHVPHAEMRDACAQWTSWWASPEACAVVNFEVLRCDIWFSKDFPPLRSWMEHEYLHCAGYDHPGDPALANAWRGYKAAIAGRAVAESVR